MEFDAFNLPARNSDRTLWPFTCAYVCRREYMKTPMQFFRTQQERGAIGYVLLWAMGVPISVLAIVFLLRGCT